MIQSRPGVVELSGSVTIHTAEQLYHELKALPSGDDSRIPLVFKLETVTEIDLAGMQTLLAFKLRRQRDTVRFSIPEEQRIRYRLCGLDKYMLSEEPLK